MTRLLIFTNEYPFDGGDSVFVEKEIKALASTFESVVVFSANRDPNLRMLPLPKGVVFGGNLFGRAKGDLRRLFRPKALAAAGRAAWGEVRSGRVRHPRELIRAVVLGLSRAGRPQVRRALEDGDCVAYGFWAMGGGLAVPWLEGVRARVVRVHRYDLYEEASLSGYLPIRPFLYSRADLILAISHDAERYLAKEYRRLELADKTVLSRLGVWGPETLVRTPPTNEFTIVSCSAVSEVKRVSLILSAVRHLAGRSGARPVRWVHFGDGPLMSDLVEAASEPTAGLTVELRGRTANTDIIGFYRTHRVDLFVNASSSEGVPVSIMEAIAHDIPVVATDVGGTSEIVGAEHRTGELVPASISSERLADAIHQTVNADESRYHPRALWESEYDARRTGAHAARLIHALADASGIGTIRLDHERDSNT